MPKKTPWFPGDVKPVRKGLYNTDAYDEFSFQYWNGEFWGLYSENKEYASSPTYALNPSSVNSPRWRGLTKEAK